MATTVMMPEKMATLGLLEIMVFQNKDDNVIFLVHDITNKNLLRDSNYITDMVMWPNFVKSSVSMRQVIVTSIL